ncbi:MAG TPA: Asp-tRNA(Asn)/Glu-tRNA(Gln) amidotransferase subunit GatB [Lachnospiraceae bacterium]|nr:Asp-tRNA(Asn)/Glu-tRNA(Gln) amidotransferase subunit GatB [Lachnospiraceae bacterium]
MPYEQYETVIGLETHVELATKTKLFCGCSTEFGGKPNSHTCPVCTGMPGSLPVLNRQALKYAIAVGLATHCEITRHSKFDRKNYFYPDNPQNYQISQLYLPICRNGWVEISTPSGKKKIGIHEIHMEEDAGKLIHDEWTDSSLVDYNRSGVPLIEIVSEPDMRSGEEVTAYLEKLRLILSYLGASDCKLEEGSMRADVNISVRPAGSSLFGTRCEMKNINSFKAIERCIRGEAERQIERIEEDKKEVVQETRRWDDNKESSKAMRSKEDAKDYRYFPDPDLVPIDVSDELLAEIKEEQPEFQEEKAVRYKEEYGLPDGDIRVLTSDKRLAEIFEETAKLSGLPKKASNWLIVETQQLMKEKNEEPKDLHFSPEHLAVLIKMADENKVSSGAARQIFNAVYENDCDPEAYAKEKGLLIVHDEGALRAAAEKAIDSNPKAAADYRAGKEKAIGALVGFVMKELHGKADPGQAGQLLAGLLKN